MTKDDLKVKRFQKALPVLRKLAGFTVEELAKELDISRATLTNLEKGHAEMTIVYYLAIERFLRESTYESNWLLYHKAWHCFVYAPEKYKNSDIIFKKAVEAANNTGIQKGIKAIQSALVEVLEEELKPYCVT